MIRLSIGVACLIAAGVAINTVVACTAALAADYQAREQRPLPDQILARIHAGGEVPLQSQQWASERALGAVKAWVLLRESPPKAVRSDPLTWVNPVPSVGHYMRYRSGFPFHCLSAELWLHTSDWSEAQAASSNATEVVGGFVVGEHPPRGPFAWRVVPLRPIWPAFLLTSLMYSLLLLCACTACTSWRRSRRRRQGRCTNCDYPRGVGAICPECGSCQPLIDRQAPKNEQGLGAR